MDYVKPLSEEKIKLYLSNYADDYLRRAFVYFRYFLDYNIKFESEKTTFSQMNGIKFRSKTDSNRVIKLSDFSDEDKRDFLNHIVDYLGIEKIGKYFIFREIYLLYFDNNFYYLLEATKNGIITKYKGENEQMRILELKEGSNRGIIQKNSTPKYVKKWDYL